MTKLCQKFTAGIQEVMGMTRVFDSKSKLSELKVLKRGLNNKLNCLLTEYQNMLWPPERCQRIDLIIGGDTEEDLIAKLDEPERNIEINDREKFKTICETQEFKEFAGKSKKIGLIKLKVRDLRIHFSKPNILSIYSMAKKLGLLLCSPVVVPYLRLSDTQIEDRRVYRVATSDMNRCYLGFDVKDHFTIDYDLEAPLGIGLDFQFVFQLPDLEEDD